MFYKDGQLYTESEIKALYPNTSFPSPFVAPEEFSVVFDTPKPECGELQVAYQDGTEIDSKGNRVVKWSIRDMFSDYTDNDGILHTKVEQETEYLAKLDADALSQKIKAATNIVDGIIQKEIDDYNIANGTAFVDVNSLPKFAFDPAYTHYSFCMSMMTWVPSLWEAARASTATDETTFIAELPTRGV